MVVSGVRKSWEMARSRLARMDSRAVSLRTCSWRLRWVVRVLVMMVTASMMAVDRMFSGTVKLKTKYGAVNT